MSARAARGGAWVRTRRLLPYLGVVVSLLVLALPAMSDQLDAWQAASHISTLSSTVEALPAELRERLRLQAERHNAWLAGTLPPEDVGDLLPYEEQLRTDGTTMMAWLEIPAIALRLPIYHGVEEPQLAAGVGHFEDTSLPVGGQSTHCVLTAHSGMPGSRMFDDIRLLVPGDRFVLWTLDEPLAYEVVGSEVVLPDQRESLGIVPGEDRCTLVTCTPYGINTHRLMVHARRCPYEPEQAPRGAVHASSRMVPLYLAIAGMAATALVVLAVRTVKRRTRHG